MHDLSAPHMKLISRFSLLALILFIFGGAQVPEPLFSEEEKQLVYAISAYRKSLGLSAISISTELTKVARYHAEDLAAFPPTNPCNMHSWSGKTKGTACCYTNDHKNPNCMWGKPAELSAYADKGYEIAAMNTDPSVDWLAQWKKSPGHHQVIINQGIWKKVTWKAMGVAIRKPYAVVWFGMSPDPATPPEN